MPGVGSSQEGKKSRERGPTGVPESRCCSAFTRRCAPLVNSAKEDPTFDAEMLGKPDRRFLSLFSMICKCEEQEEARHPPSPSWNYPR
jgi:hypothetical protein